MQLTLIHIGDLHGHLIPRPHCRDGDKGGFRGGLARLYTRIRDIRARAPHSLLINTGDTVQGSAEVLYTRGQAIVDVLNEFGIDAYAPGNWDYVYGTARFIELFAGANPLGPWNGLAANLYYARPDQAPDSPYLDRAGERVLPPYRIIEVGGARIGILGFTTDRGPQAIGDQATRGFVFTKGDREVETLVPHLRQVEKVDAVIMISELGLANNVRLADAHRGIDVILSSDMHEETARPVVSRHRTIIVEEGQDGSVLGEITLTIGAGGVSGLEWQFHQIDAGIDENERVAAHVAEVRRTFVSGDDFTQHVNPFNGSRLKRPIDTVVGHTANALQRANFSDSAMPAVIEGSSHDFLTDAFRDQTGADIGAIRGFRYGTHVPPGPIRLEDVYHFIPIGPQIASGIITGEQVRNQIENSADGALSPVITEWSGGWVFSYSGITFDLDPYAAKGMRSSRVKIGGVALDPSMTYRYASYWYSHDPLQVNGVPAEHVEVLKDEDGMPLDATEVVVRYLESMPSRRADTPLRRITLLKPLPPPVYGNREIQPLRGGKI